MFKKTPQERIDACQKDILKALAKYKCVLNAKIILSTGNVEPQINIEALKEEVKTGA